MKKIRLEIPLNEGNLPTNRVWLKVTNSQTEAFEDKEFTKNLLIGKEKISFDVEVPKELELIEVIGLGGATPDADISFGWCMDEADPNWRIPGLQKVIIIFDDRTHEVPVIDEKPDTNEWDNYRNYECNGCLFTKNWALEVYTINSRTIAAFHWHPNLIRELKTKRRKIELSKKGFPCIWEKGGQIDKFTGNATIVCDVNGNKKKAIFIRKKGPLACSEHALIAIDKEDIIVEVSYGQNSFEINVLQVTYINKDECECEVEYKLSKSSRIHGLYYGIEDDIEQLCKGDDMKKYTNAVLSAYKKARYYHCRTPFFVTE